MRRLLLTFAVLAVIACEGPLVPPDTLADMYDFRLATTPPSVLRWPSGTRVRVHVHALPGARADLLGSALSGAGAEWNRHAYFGEYELVDAGSLRDADVLLRWSDEPAPVDLSGCQPVVSTAVTTFCLTDDEPARLETFPLQPPDDAAESSVRFVITILGGLAGQPEQVRDLVMHEIGHALGIATHSPHADDLMRAGAPPRSTPSRRDITTIQVLYHTQPDITP